jgi:hypothetical protein
MEAVLEAVSMVEAGAEELVLLSPAGSSREP